MIGTKRTDQSTATITTEGDLGRSWEVSYNSRLRWKRLRMLEADLAPEDQGERWEGKRAGGLALLCFLGRMLRRATANCGLLSSP